jgi:hypothetical protein
MPNVSLMSPAALAAMTSSRSSSALPWDSDHSRSTEAESTGPPRTWCSSVAGIERAELDPLDQVVGPQCADRVGHGLAGAHRRQDGRVLGPGDVVHERGRQRVEQVGVVDRHDDRPARGLPVQRVDGPAQQPGWRTAGRLVGWKHLGEAAQRQAGGGRVGGRGPHGEAVRVERGHPFSDQPALSDTGGSAKDQAATRGAVGGLHETGELD